MKNQSHGNLALTRKKGESVIIYKEDENQKVVDCMEILMMSGNYVKLFFKVPHQYKIVRKELLYDKINEIQCNTNNNKRPKIIIKKRKQIQSKKDNN